VTGGNSDFPPRPFSAEIDDFELVAAGFDARRKIWSLDLGGSRFFRVVCLSGSIRVEERRASHRASPCDGSGFGIRIRPVPREGTLDVVRVVFFLVLRGIGRRHVDGRHGIHQLIALAGAFALLVFRGLRAEALREAIGDRVEEEAIRREERRAREGERADHGAESAPDEQRHPGADPVADDAAERRGAVREVAGGKGDFRDDSERQHRAEDAREFEQRTADVGAGADAPSDEDEEEGQREGSDAESFDEGHREPCRDLAADVDEAPGSERRVGGEGDREPDGDGDRAPREDGETEFREMSRSACVHRGSSSRRPVEPKPPRPRVVSDRTSRTSKIARATGQITSCAIRMPRRMTSGVEARHVTMTQISPR
jgi:hypothetical protein